MINVNEFDYEIDCIYKGEKYLVRDNGAVLRQRRTDKPLRPRDNDWTFGKPCARGYLSIAGIVIHRIVATAFHGAPPTKEHVVDHIDTNRQNNRSENLKWLTRLENVLKNPITVKRIELVCGSLEAFLENPSLLSDCKLDPNFKWMRTVTPEEAKNCKERMHLWVKSDKSLSGGSMGEWIYKPIITTQCTPETCVKAENIKAKISTGIECTPHIPVPLQDAKIGECRVRVFTKLCQN